MITVDELRLLGTPYYFGLGFIQLKVDKAQRYHFYHPELMPILDEEEIHDHRYDFRSTVVKGRLVNEVYTASRQVFSELGKFEVSCKKEDAGKEPVLVDEVTIDSVVTFSLAAGSEYTLKSDMFHRVRYPEPTVTHLYRGPVHKDYANVIKPIGAPDVCPFSKVMEEEEVWEIIADILAA